MPDTCFSCNSTFQFCIARLNTTLSYLLLTLRATCNVIPIVDDEVRSMTQFSSQPTSQNINANNGH
ncbi:MAG TPA: hypothetical protein V6C91_18455, partial [Coleofasciculaceae cyanobacterium]